MLMTEEQAKAKWCPHARASNEQESAVAVNRSAVNKPDRDCFCIASACMAWRWNDGEQTRRFVVFKDNPRSRSNHAPHLPDGVSDTWEWLRHGEGEGRSPLSAGFREPQCDADARRRGYCGAFGKPEA